MSADIKLEDEVASIDNSKQKLNGKVITSISTTDISVVEDVLVTVNSPDPIQLKIERIMAKAAYERKIKTRSKNMSIFKWLLRFFACFFLTLSILLLLLLTFVFSQDQFSDVTDKTPSLTSVKPTIFINTKFKVPASVRDDLMLLL